MEGWRDGGMAHGVPWSTRRLPCWKYIHLRVGIREISQYIAQELLN
jgi:hypothetical protein